MGWDPRFIKKEKVHWLLEFNVPFQIVATMQSSSQGPADMPFQG